MRVTGVINRRSGTCIDQETGAIQGALQAAFEARGHECRIECVPPGEVADALARAVAQSPDVLMACGGDGTIRAAAEAVVGRGIALAVIPLGTFNRFARDLRLPLDPVVAAKALASGEPRAVDVAEVNGKVFLCNSMLGLPPEFSSRRAALRGKSLFARLRGYVSLAKAFVASTRKITVSLDDGGRQRRLRALSIIVSNNLYGEEVSASVLRESLDQGVLGIYVSRHESGAGMAMAFVRAMLGAWKSDPKLVYAKAAQLTIETQGHHVRVSNDGEVETLSSPLAYRIRPKALLVLAPANGTAAVRTGAPELEPFAASTRTPLA